MRRLHYIKRKKFRRFLILCPEFSEDELEKFLIKRAKMAPYKRADQFFTGLSNKKLLDLWVKEAGISKEKKVECLQKKKFSSLSV